MRIRFEEVQGEVKGCEFVEETIDPYSVEDLKHIQENYAC
jgi:hypothetical protein